MSKVKITGNASGTGTLTIAAPNTNTDRTLTLPDAAGSFVTADSSGRVGIGTSSPDALLDVENSTSPKIRVGDGARHVEVRGGSTTQNPAIGTYYAGDLGFATNSTERMRIDSAGRVTMPYQPMWRLRGPTSNSHSAYEKIRFATEDIMQGGCSWSTSNYQITVPTTGKYQINVLINMRNNPSQTANGIRLLVNGAVANVQNYFQANNIWGNISFSTILHLSANDTLSVQNAYNFAIDIDTGIWGGFSGHLIG